MLFVIYAALLIRICSTMSHSANSSPNVPHSAFLLSTTPATPPINVDKQTLVAVSPSVCPIELPNLQNETLDAEKKLVQCVSPEVQVSSIIDDIIDITNDIQPASDTNELLSDNERSILKTDSFDNSPLTNMNFDGLIDSSEDEQTQRNRSRRRDRKELRKSPKPKRPQPNSFVAVQISSSIIRRKLEEVQDSIVKYDNHLKKVLTSLKKLHITLMVIRMEKDEDIERGRKALHEASDMIKKQFNGKPLVLKFHGLDTFGSKVVFSSVSDGLDGLQSIAGIVREVFQKNGIKSTDKKKGFNPHATIAKVSKSRIRSIPHESFSNYSNTEFGIETVTSIELLSMTEPATDDGYYYCFERTQFTQ